MVLDVKTKVYIVVGGTSVVSMAIGAAASYFVTKQMMETKYEQILAEEIAEAKRFYSKLNKVEEYASPVAVLKSKVEEFGYGDIEPTENVTPRALVDENVERTVNIFEEQTSMDNFDLATELKMRSGDKPYIITHDEFYENAADWEQVQLTYFEEDDVLCNEQDTPIADSDAMVGDKNLSRFGAGSKDNNVVYIQNDTLELLFEVVRNKGNYAKEVLGFIEHTEHRGLRRFRSDDE